MPLDDFDIDEQQERGVFNLPQARQEELDTIIDEHDADIVAAPNTAVPYSRFSEFQDNHPRARFICHVVTLDDEPSKIVVEGIKYRGPPQPDMLVDFIDYFGSADEFGVKDYDGDTVKLRAWYD